MKAKKYSYDNYDVYIVKSKKFKTIKIHTAFFNDYENEDRTKAKLLTNVLCRTTGKYKTEIEVSKEIMNLYNPGLGGYNSFLDDHMIMFKLTFLNEKYTEKGMNKKTIDFYYDIVFNPNLDGEKFESENFNLSKKTLKSMYNREKENPGYFAYKNATKLISDDLPIKYPNYGCEEELEDITEESLYKYYKKLLEKPFVSVFVMGDVNEEEILKQINDNLKDKTFKKRDYEIRPFKVHKVKKVTEKIMEENYNQSNLLMFYKVHNLTDFERRYVLDIFNRLLGAPFTSKLFLNVREKNSMAYAISSSTYSMQNLLCVDAGISSENYEKVVELIKEQIKDVQDGNITDKELDIAKESAITALQRALDSQNGTLSIIIDEELFHIPNNEEDIKKVTKEDIINLSKKLDLDVVFLLKGVNK